MPQDPKTWTGTQNKAWCFLTISVSGDSKKFFWPCRTLRCCLDVFCCCRPWCTELRCEQHFHCAMDLVICRMQRLASKDRFAIGFVLLLDNHRDVDGCFHWKPSGYYVCGETLPPRREFWRSSSQVGLSSWNSQRRSNRKFLQGKAWANKATSILHLILETFSLH